MSKHECDLCSKTKNLKWRFTQWFCEEHDPLADWLRAATINDLNNEFKRREGHYKFGWESKDPRELLYNNRGTSIIVCTGSELFKGTIHTKDDWLFLSSKDDHRSKTATDDWPKGWWWVIGPDITKEQKS